MGLFGKHLITGYRSQATMSPKMARAYSLWQTMICRCFGRDTPKSERKLYPVHGSWKSFDNFLQWFQDQPCNDLERVCINRDLLYPHNKVYSADACVLLPKELHDLLIESKVATSDLEALAVEYVGSHGEGVENAIRDAYDAAKAQQEENIRMAAIKYRDVLDTRAYEALMLYKIEIDKE